MDGQTGRDEVTERPHNRWTCECVTEPRCYCHTVNPWEITSYPPQPTTHTRTQTVANVWWVHLLGCGEGRSVCVRVCWGGEGSCWGWCQPSPYPHPACCCHSHPVLSTAASTGSTVVTAYRLGRPLTEDTRSRERTHVHAHTHTLHPLSGSGPRVKCLLTAQK